MPTLYGFWIFPILDPILDLARRDIDDQLPELDRVARAFEALGRHFVSALMPQGVQEKMILPPTCSAPKPEGTESMCVLRSPLMKDQPSSCQRWAVPELPH